MENDVYDNFVENVKDHKLTIKMDNGLYRHLHFSKGSFEYWFDLITWPGYLAITGDCGDFVFSRIDDMFSFFRDEKKENRINASYWAEKVTADAKYSDIKKFDPDKFHDNVIEHTKIMLDLEEDESIPDDIMNEIYPLLHTYDEWECVQSIRDFESKKINFNDFWDYNHMSYNYGYLWCLYAIVWGIDRYDEAKETE